MKINESYKPILKNWLYGLAFYFIPFIIGYFAFRFVLSDNVLHTDVDSARYMLSALIQSEAAIVALVVTLSLVAACGVIVFGAGDRGVQEGAGFVDIDGDLRDCDFLWAGCAEDD